MPSLSKIHKMPLLHQNNISSTYLSIVYKKNIRNSALEGFYHFFVALLDLEDSAHVTDFNSFCPNESSCDSTTS